MLTKANNHRKKATRCTVKLVADCNKRYIAKHVEINKTTLKVVTM